jgi:hypothetical protein
MNIAELRVIRDPDFDDKRVAQGVLERSDAICTIKRSAPCSDCAVVCGFYSDYAAAAFKYLSESDRRFIAERWDCHNGGRCEGAYRVLLDQQPVDSDSQIR